jgi:hypothetical protein
MDMENFIRFVIIIFAFVLFVVGAFLYFQKATVPASSAMGFVLLLVFVLTISNYKRIKFWGLEAEMWEDKQVQAAKLIDRLELLTRTSSQQLALIASKLGLWDSGLSNPQTAELVDNVQRLLQMSGMPETERKNMLAPLYQRVALNYVHAATRMVENELRKEREGNEAALRGAQQGDAEEAQKLSARLREAEEVTRRLRELSVQNMIEQRTIQPIQNLVSGTAIWSVQSALVNDLNEIAADMSYFETNGRLRRNIDWAYLYKSQ